MCAGCCTALWLPDAGRHLCGLEIRSQAGECGYAERYRYAMSSSRRSRLDGNLNGSSNTDKSNHEIAQDSPDNTWLALPGLVVRDATSHLRAVTVAAQVSALAAGGPA